MRGMTRNRRAMVVAGPREDLCLAFANTLSWRGSAAPVDGIADFAALLGWCGRVRTLPAAAAQQLSAWSRKHPGRAADVHADAIALREAIYRACSALANGKRVRADDFAPIGRAVVEAPGRHCLVQAGQHFCWQFEMGEVGTGAIAASVLLAPVLWSAADLLASGGQARVRCCANVKCLWLFLDRSKSGTRRWCDMASCGNRAKAQRHYRKSRA
jgi:predicted RNA-binding Zn ribbon-like protein